MARILLVSSGIPSPLRSVVTFAERLRDDGHIVSVAAPKHAKQTIDPRGLAFHEIPPPKVNAFAPLITRPKFLDRLRPGERRRRRMRAERAFGIDRFAALLVSVAPDLVVIDAELHAHVMVAQSEGHRVILCSSMYVTPPSPERPPLHYRLVPGRGIWGSQGAVRLSWLWYRSWRALTILKKKLLYQGGDYATAAASLAKTLGYDLAANRETQCWQMPWSLKIRTLVFLPGEIDFPPHMMPSHDYVGPMIFQGGIAEKTNGEAVERFRDAITGPRIFAAFGTLLTPDGDFLKRLWAAVEQNPDWTLLCVLGRGGQDTFGPSPKNVLLADWVPQAELLTLSDAFVFPGGSASVVEAVAARTPMLIYPQTIDQFGNGARVAYHRLGRVGQPGDDTRQIERHLHQIMADPGMKERLDAFKTAQETYASNKVAERLVAEILASDHATTDA